MDKIIAYPIQRSEFLLPDTNEHYQRVFKLYGASHTITPVMGNQCVLHKLKPGQSVCAGGKDFYFLLTHNSKDLNLLKPLATVLRESENYIQSAWASPSRPTIASLCEMYNKEALVKNWPALSEEGIRSLIRNPIKKAEKENTATKTINISINVIDKSALKSEITAILLQAVRDVDNTHNTDGLSR